MTSHISEREAFSSSGVIERVRSMSELNTVEMYFNEIIDFENAKFFNSFEIPFTQKSFIFTVKARVKAGIDLSSIKEEEGVPNAQDMIKLLVQGQEAVVRTARGIFPLLDKVSDEPTADLLTQRMQVHEKTAWMLRSLLAA